MDIILFTGNTNTVLFSSLVYFNSCAWNLNALPDYYTCAVDILPAPPNLSFDEENNTVCILPVDEEDNPPDSYSVTVYDITAEKILDESNISATHSIFCIEMHGYSRDCAPLSVYARAINRYGQMGTTISTPTLTNSTNATGKICTCLNETGICHKISIIIMI